MRHYQEYVIGVTKKGRKESMGVKKKKIRNNNGWKFSKCLKNSKPKDQKANKS